MIAVLPHMHWMSVIPQVPKSELKHDRYGF
jgi:hypothetical protein